MFGPFKKKKPKTTMDMLILQMYGSLDHKKTADIQLACQIAYRNLLCECIAEDSIRKKADELFAGPIPYSTNDLALSVAMAFFRSDEHSHLLEEAQLVARMQLIDWVEEGTVAKPLAMVFENTLYCRFNPQC